MKKKILWLKNLLAMIANAVFYFILFYLFILFFRLCETSYESHLIESSSNQIVIEYVIMGAGISGYSNYNGHFYATNGTNSEYYGHLFFLIGIGRNFVETCY
jgi:hypothetical protein